MAMTMDELTEQALSLPSEARALLADRIVESLDASSLGQIDQLWIAAAKRRRDDVRSGRVTTIPGDEALVRVRRAVGHE